MKQSGRTSIIYMAVWIVVFLMSVSQANTSNDINVTTNVDKNRIHVGDPITLTINITAPSNTRILFPEDTVNIDPFSVLNIRHEVNDIDTDKIQQKIIMTISAYEIGEFDIPSFEINYKQDNTEGTLETDSTYILIESVLSETNSEPKEIKNPLTATASLKYKITVLLLFFIIIAVIAVSIWYLNRWKKSRSAAKEKKKKIIPQLPPDQIALNALEKLQAKTFLSEGKIKSFYVELSEIFKRYFGARYGIPTIERTTGEIRQDLFVHTIDKRSQREILDILDLSDLVKFAKHSPSDQANYSSFDKVKEFVLRTREVPIHATEQDSPQVQS